MTEITKPGIYDMDAATYHADPVPEGSLSSSGAKKILNECPARYRYDADHPDTDDTPAKQFGRMQHELMLEGQIVSFVRQPDGLNLNSKAGKEWKETIAAAGQQRATGEAWDTAETMVQAIKDHPFARAAFMNGQPEKSLFWHDEEFEIWRRCRLDWMPEAGGVIFCDYKTVQSAKPSDLSRAVFNFGYHQQAAWYLDGIKALGLADNPAFAFVFQEKTPPYLLTVVQLSDAAVGWGRILNRQAMATYKTCMTTGKWPGYAEDVINVDLPEWAERQLEKRHEAGEFS